MGRRQMNILLHKFMPMHTFGQNYQRGAPGVAVHLRRPQNAYLAGLT